MALRTEALSALKKIATGNVTCRRTGYDSFYDRTVAICSANGVEINSTMVRQGWAFAFTKYIKMYMADEKAAQNAKIGVWAGVVQAPWEWRADALKKQIASFGCGSGAHQNPEQVNCPAAERPREVNPK